MQKTWGEMAKKAVASRGLPFFSDVLDDVKARLLRVEPRAASALAAACASRLMAAHTSRPSADQRPLTLAWNDTLGFIWEALLAENSGRAAAKVKRALEAFRASPYNHSDGQDGPDDANDDAAAAAIYSAESLCNSDAAAASWATHRLIDWAFSAAEADLGHSDDPLGTAEQFIAEAGHPRVQAELDRLLGGLKLLEREGTSAPILEKLRGMFVAG